MSRRWIVVICIAVAFVLCAAGLAFYAYTRYVPQTYTASDAQLARLSPGDREIVAESTRLGRQAGVLGEKLGQAAIFGSSESSAQYGAELEVIGARLVVLSRNASDPQLKAGLSQAGRGAILTAQGIKESAPSKVDEGLRLVKQSQETLRDV